jgi:hypothetical protein
MALKEIVYSKNVVEFVTVANEYCTFLEKVSEHEKPVFIDKSLKLLSLLYLKVLLLPEVEQVNDDPNEKFVTEFDWQFIRNGVQSVLGDDDTYLDFFDLQMHETPEPTTNSISENLADIYQDLKDFLEIYKLGVEDLSNDAILECISSFREFWGFRLVNTTKMLHHMQYSTKDEGNTLEPTTRVKRKTKEWFISKAQEDFRKDE